MSNTTTRLLRRTLASLGAGLLLVAGAPAFAQGTVTLSGATGNTCTYSQMTVQPNGTIQVTCSNGQTNTTLANFALSAPATLPANSSGAATVTRAGGPTEALMALYSVSGTGCSSSSGGIMLTAGQSQSIGFTIGAAGSSCSITIGAPAGGHTANPNTVAVAVSTGTTPPPTGGGGTTPPAGCPAIPTTSIDRSGILTDTQAVDQLMMVPGAIAYYPIISPPNPAQSVIVEFSQTQMARSPASVKTEFQVSRCPGVWDPPGETIAAECKYSGSFVNINNLKVWTDPASPFVDQSTIAWRGCYAPKSNGQYYMNVRWTYSSCPYGTGQCGFSMRWIQWGSNG